MFKMSTLTHKEMPMDSSGLVLCIATHTFLATSVNYVTKKFNAIVLKFSW